MTPGMLRSVNPATGEELASYPEHTAEELDQALAAGVDRVLLDNMSLDDMREAVSRAAGGVALEASGGITLETIRAVAETGVDYISVGALTHSAPALDLTLLLHAG